MIFSEEKIRAPVAAGLFYPDEKEKILETFISFGLDLRKRKPLELPTKNSPGESEQTKGFGVSNDVLRRSPSLAVIVPHNAWNLSGKAVAKAFCTCTGRRNAISRVVILGTVHDAVKSSLILTASDSFDTPLGKINIDQSTNEELTSCSTAFEVNDIPHLQELSIEVLLPFVKYCFPKAAIVPILMGRSFPSLVKGFASALHVVFDCECDKTLFVISSSLARNTTREKAHRQAKRFVQLVLEGRGKTLGKSFFAGHISGCCAPLVAAFLESGLATNRKSFLLPPGIQHISGQGSHACFGSIAIC